jgi:hypothetical protein
MALMSATRMAIRLAMPRAIAEGMNTVSFEKLMRGYYPKLYRRTNYLADWREFEGRERKRDPLKSIPKKLRPTWDTMEVSEGLQRGRFNYHFTIKGYDPILGEDIEQGMTVSSDIIVNMEEAERVAREQMEKYEGEVEISVIERESVTYRGY